MYPDPAKMSDRTLGLAIEIAERNVATATLRVEMHGRWLRDLLTELASR